MESILMKTYSKKKLFLKSTKDLENNVADIAHFRPRVHLLIYS